MGIKDKNVLDCVSDLELCNNDGPDSLSDTLLIIDFTNVTDSLQRSLSTKSEGLGGNYDLFGWRLTQFFKLLKSCDITPIVVQEGIQYYLDSSVNNPDKKRKPRDREKVRNPLLLPYVIYNITQMMGIQFVRPFDGSNDNTIAALAEVFDCPVLSSDNDFFFHGVKFIPYRYLKNLNHYKEEDDYGYVLPCRKYSIDELFNKYKGFNRSLLPLALELLQTQSRNCTFERFFNEIPEDEHIPHTLTWLSKFNSSNEAVTGMLEYISDDEKLMVLDQLKKKIREFNTMPAEILPYLGLDETTVDNLKRKKEQQQRDLSLPERQRHILEGEEVITGEMIMEVAPKCWCLDFLKTAVPKGIVMKLVIHFVRMAKFKTDEPFDAMNEAEIPVITKISELLISSMKNQEYILNLPIKDRNYEKRSINIEKFQIDLENFRTFKVDVRVDLLHEILGIKKGKILQEIPEAWRLYVATIIYWMKRKCEFEKNNAHLFSLLFTMLFGVIDENLGFYRTKPNNRSGYMASKHRDEHESLAYNDLNVTKKECQDAAEFFRDNSIMDDDEFDKVTDSKQFESYFWDFQKCLMLTLQVNALLNCPYVPTPIHEVYSGTLLYNVFKKFSAAENIDKCVQGILNKSPGLISVFERLKGVVLPELVEQN